MGRALNRMRDKLQRRASSQAKAAAPAIHQVQTNYGCSAEHVYVTFSEPVQQIVMTPEQTQDMLKSLLGALETQQKQAAK